MSALTDRVRHNAVETNRREQQCEPAKQTGQQCRRSFLRGCVSNLLLKSANVEKRNARIKPIELFAYRRGKRRRITLRTNQQIHFRPVNHQEGLIQAGQSGFAHAAILAIASHADNFRECIFVAEAESLADWIFIREKLACECLVDDGNGWAAAPVLQAKV